MDSSAAELGLARSRGRSAAPTPQLGAARQVLHRRRVGYVVNLAVFTLAFHALAALPRRRVCSFLVAVTNNYCGTGSGRSGPAWPRRVPGDAVLRRLDLALGANLLVLYLLVTAGVDEVLAQAVAIVLVTPVNFVGNKLWSFGPRR